MAAIDTIWNKSMLKGSTIVEVLSALVVITVVAGISSVIFLNILGRPGSMLELEAKELLRTHLEKLTESGLKDDEIVTANNITIKQVVTDYDNNPDLKLLHLQVYGPQGKLILERKKIIALYEN